MSFKTVFFTFCCLLFSCSDIPTENKIFKQNPVNLLDIITAKTFGTTPLNGNSFVQTSTGINSDRVVTIYFDEWFNLRQFSSIDFNPVFYTVADSTVLSNDLSYRLRVSDISVTELSEITLLELESKYLGVDIDFKFGVEFHLYSGVTPNGGAPYLPASTEFHITDIQLLATLK